MLSDKNPSEAKRTPNSMSATQKATMDVEGAVDFDRVDTGSGTPRAQFGGDTRAELSDTRAELSDTRAELSDTRAELSDTRAELSDELRLEQSEALIANYHHSVYRYAFWLSGCAQSAEDITQEVFLRAFRGLHRLRDEQAVKGWLMTITRNEFARWCRKRVPKPVPEIAEGFELVAHTAEATENIEWVSRGLAKLPQEFRVVLLMFYFEQLSYAQISEALSIPMGTVMSRMNRGRLQLKEALEGLAEPNNSRRSDMNGD